MSSRNRIAIVNPDKCKPNKCQQECKKGCPVVRQGKQCITVNKSSKIGIISEDLCTGCGICTKKCPFKAIRIINLPRPLTTNITHRYGANTFRLHHLPAPRRGQVLGLVGINGIGKSTALKVLSGKLKPNLGKFENPPDWSEILASFRGSDMQAYFTKLAQGRLTSATKPQYVDDIPRGDKGAVGQRTVGKYLDQTNDQRLKELELTHLLDRKIEELSGGELQRFAIAATAAKDVDIYMFDESSSFLDIKQRLKASNVIRSLVKDDNYVIIVEHDLSLLDYLSDFICCLYGDPGAYGVVTLPFLIRDGINIFLSGEIPTENLRFRDESLVFRASETLETTAETHSLYKYPTMVKKQGDFKLKVLGGEFTDSQIIVMLGENGTGKTTFIKMLAGESSPDEADGHKPQFIVSYKRQIGIVPKTAKCTTVKQLLDKKMPDMCSDPQFKSDVMNPMKMESLMDKEVENLSRGELQRLALVICLGKTADIYLIDEPSAYLDAEQRMITTKVIKRFIMHNQKTAFVVEHDFLMATGLADRVLVFQGQPGLDCVANAPQSLLTGMDLFLSHLDITFRRDPTNFRPRINKLHSTKDMEQKKLGSYYYLD